MSKFIGLTADVFLDPTSVINQQRADFVPRAAVNAVLAAGGIPVILPYLPEDRVDALLEKLDGVILTGGTDLDPTLVGDNPLPQLGRTYRPRDQFEMTLVTQAAARQIPILGICRGMQVLNVALGGSVYQDLPTQYPGKPLLQHHQSAPGDLPTHRVTIQPSALQAAIGTHPLVNSRHHQAVKAPAAALRVVATAPDGVIEGIESSDALLQGVQWHPENLWTTRPEQQALFQAFVDRLN